MSSLDIRPEVREAMIDIGRRIAAGLPDTHGFALLVFDMNTDSGHMSYMSNAERATMLAALKEFIAHEEGRMMPASRARN